MISEPMKAGKLDLTRLRYPCLLQPKYDGIRCLRIGEHAYTRAFKLVPNAHIQALVSTLPIGLDGELMVGEFNQCQSGVMKRGGQPDFTYHVFDNFAHPGRYIDRYDSIQLPETTWVAKAPYVWCENEESFYAYESLCLEAGFEGIMVRDPDGPYKCGRSTPREGWLLKFKRTQDAEAVVIGFVEARTNMNPIVPNAFGRARRPGGQALKFAKGTLGAFACRTPAGVDFEVGTGMDEALRAHVWANQANYLGRTLTYTYQAIGTLNRPRFPTFKGFRND